MMKYSAKKYTAHWLLAPLCALPVVGLIGCNGDNNSGGPSPNPTATATPVGTPNGTPTVAPTSTPGGTAGANIIGLTSNGEIVTFNSASPDRITLTRRIIGLQGLDQLIGIDYRPANRQLYALSRTRLYRFSSLGAGTVQAVGNPFNTALTGTSFGFDFNPVPDRIRVVSDNNQNLRINPNSGAIVDANTDVGGVQLDGTLAYAPSDVNLGRDPNIVGAAYTNSVAGAASTTNFAIDSSLDILATQGTRAGTSPVVSPNSGQLFTVGSLGVDLQNVVGFDIGPRQNQAFIAGSVNSASGTGGLSLLRVDLSNGRATNMGRIGGSTSNINLIGIAVQP
ncbi:MAG: hypothetical protein JWN98_670 [Abditibacteriota bacterium]|nr:hypothetical protein [Abditibacteriota bacterium]